MDRRNFLKNSTLLLYANSLNHMERTPNITGTDMVKRVIMAMLGMQRYAWEQGVAAQALLEWGEEELVKLMAQDAVRRQWPDGRLAVVSDNHGVTDPAANGEPVLFASRLTKDAKLAAGVKGMFDYLMLKAPRTSAGVLYHVDHKPQVWIDSMYMAPPFLAVAGKPEAALKQIKGMRTLLWNKKKRLFSQIWDDGEKRFVRKDFWGVGNGWAAAGMSRVIQALPVHLTREKKELIHYVKQVIDGCLVYIRKDGFFHDVVDDRTTFVETNLSQILAYTIYRGVRGKWLEPSYLKFADHMRRSAHTKVDNSGLVQDVCGAPEFSSAGIAVEGQAFFILMEAAYRDCCQR